MIVGFTGTQEGMNALQKAMLVGVLACLCPTQAHFGDCIGADKEFYEVVRAHWPRCWIVSHPPDNISKRAFCDVDEERRSAPYLVRNRVIVLHCAELIAAPRTRVEELRSGTWSTIRAARRAGKPVHMIWP